MWVYALVPLIPLLTGLIAQKHYGNDGLEHNEPTASTKSPMPVLSSS
jgi:hypothetical protein